ncbi:AAA family ATPase [Desulfobacterales bacterium HSG16]|nr:AAA family ATPase [Desulfobacterales bacterium HSG16]
MAQLMIHRNLFKNLNKLPAKVQKRVGEFVDIFQENPNDPSIHLHSLKEMMVDPKVRGANLPGAYRAIIIAPEKGDTYLLVHIDAHDKAYEWAKNKRFEIHKKTGVFQLFDVTEVKNVIKERSDIEVRESNYPINLLSDEDLFKAGVPEPLIPAVMAIASDDDLDALSDYLPKDCRDVLCGIAAGMSLDDSLKEMLGIDTGHDMDKTPDGPGDFTHINDNINFDLVFVKGEEHLKDILTASLEEWRIFLHPYQKKLVEWKTKGPMNINGSAGTGKTVALLHRSVYLAGKLENSKDKILITTFTTNLACTLRDLVKKMDKNAPDRIEIINLHKLANIICSRSGWTGRIGSQADYESIWESIWTRPDLGELPMSRDEMKKEYELIIDANGIDNEEAYLTTIRSGRKRLVRKDRRRAWPIFRDFGRQLKKRNILTFEGAVHQARLAVEQGNFQGYRHVLVDEVQDFSLEALRLIRALSPVDTDMSDPLCTVGDGHQRIYRSKIPMSRAGIEIRGRSRRLKINYRTSEQIRQYAQTILNGLEIDDLNGGTASIIGDHSAFKGPEPDIEFCENISVEADTVATWVEMLLNDQGFATHEICITPYKPEIITALNKKNIPVLQLKPREVDPGENESGIRMGTIHRIKGLEFRAIALACADLNDPLNDLDNAQQSSRCERYVAATRAREHLLVTLALKA